MKPLRYGPIALSPLTGFIGAEVESGAHIGELDDETFACLRRAWVDWKVLFFRDQHNVTTPEHIAFGRRFGELEIHPFLPNNGHPEIVVLDTAGDGPARAEAWHTDVSFRECPPDGSILRGCILPEVGGDTSWTDMEAAYELLDDKTRDQIENMTATHSIRNTFGRRLTPEQLEEKLAEFPDQHHPLVRVHPETGRRSLYVNRPFVTHIDGMDAPESNRLLQSLLRFPENVSIQCRFRWKPGSFAIWDNRSTQHAAAQDFGDVRRRMERVTLLGSKPFGPSDSRAISLVSA